MLPTDGPLRTDLHAAGIETLVRPLAVLRRELLSVRGAGRLAHALSSDAITLPRLIRGRGVSLIHSNTSAVLGGAVGARFARVPHVWHVREIYTPFGRLWPPYRRVLCTADALACVSAATAAPFGASERVHILPDGLALDPGRAPRPAARAALDLDPEGPVLAVVGRISDWKGQDVALRALATPQLRQRSVTLLLAGGTWAGAERRLTRVLSLADELRVRDRIAVRGFRDDMENVFGAADVVAVPSTAPDPLPNAALEACAAGCAVVASNCGGLPEIIRDGVTGRLVAPGSAEALATVCAALLDDPAERARLGTAAATDVRARFARARLLRGVQALWDEVLDR